MPSTASEPHLRVPEEPQASADPHRPSSGSRTSSSSSSKSSSLSKSASSPNLDAQGGGGVGEGDPAGPKPDCLSRFRSLVNGLDHSLFPSGDHTRFDESQRFDTPSVEPTLNQTALMGGMCPDVRLRMQSHVPGDGLDRGPEAYKGGMENSYKVLPEARAEACRVRPETQSQAGASGGPAGLYPGSLGPLQAQALLREHAAANAYEAQSLQDACSALSSCHQQQQHKQQLENLRMQVEQMQVSKMKATESIWKLITNQVFSNQHPRLPSASTPAIVDVLWIGHQRPVPLVVLPLHTPRGREVGDSDQSQRGPAEGERDPDREVSSARCT